MLSSRHHIIGTGRWGTWLARRLQETGHSVATVRNRTIRSAKRLAEELSVQWSKNDFEQGILIQAGDFVWCCVPDAELPALSKQVRETYGKVAIIHCSGTSPLLKGELYGVFWPIMSFTSESTPDWASLPIIIQASSPAFAKTLSEIAEKISGLPPKLVTADKDRMRLHLGAVMTQNFSNVLWRLTAEVLAKADLDYKELLPLAQNHLKKLATQSPTMLQTGPANRGDQNTLDAHLALLNDHLEAKEIYTLLSGHIAKKEN